jgi:hypothetical protein
MKKKILFLISCFSIYWYAGYTQSVINDPTWNTTAPIMFSEEFSSALNTTKWWNQYSWGGTNNGLEYNTPTNLLISNGVLKIRTRNVASNGKPFTGGAIHSKSKFKYGYFEINTKIPKGKGFFPAFWLFNGSCWPGAEFYNEIDIMEMYGNYSAATTNIYSSYHWLNNLVPIDCNNRSAKSDELASGIDLSLNYNKFSVEWMPNYMIFFFNDIPFHMNYTPSIIPHNEMHIIANLAIHDDYSNGGQGIINTPPSIYEPDATTPFPSYMDIDWIRAYSFKKDYINGQTVCNFVKSSHDFKVYKTLTIGGACVTTINSSDNVTFRAKDEILISGGTTIIGNGSGHVTFLVTGNE